MSLIRKKKYYKHILYKLPLCEDVMEIVLGYLMDLEYTDRRKNVVHELNNSVLIYNDFFYRLIGRVKIVDRRVIEDLEEMKEFCYKCSPIIRKSDENDLVILNMVKYCRKTKPRMIYVRANGYWFDENFITWIDYF